MTKSDGSDYFQRSDLTLVAIITVTFGYFALIVYAPESIPYESLGSFGSFTKYLVENHGSVIYQGWVVMWIIHVIEASHAVRLCRLRGITDGATRCLWALQTFLFGYASLSLLRHYKPDRPKQN